MAFFVVSGSFKFNPPFPSCRNSVCLAIGCNLYWFIYLFYQKYWKIFLYILVLILIGIGKMLLPCVNPLKKVTPSINIVSYCCFILIVGSFCLRHQLSFLLKGNIVVFSIFDVTPVALLNWQRIEVLFLVKVYIEEKS